MKTLKRILAFLAILIALVLIIALFVKKDYAVERQISINKPKAEVFNYIRFLKNQRHYSVWAQKDPNMEMVYKGTDGTVGFVAAWRSNDDEVGTGQQEIIKITDGERIDLKLKFKVPFEAEDDAYFTTEPLSGGETNVKWGFKGKFNYPMNIMGLFFNMDKMVGGDLEKGLKNLKVELEK